MNNRYLRWIHPIKRSILSSICVFFFILFSAKSTTQTEKFDSIYFETAVNIAAKDVNKALFIADSLFKNSSSVVHKIKSLMLSSSLYQQKGDLVNSVRIAEKAYIIADKDRVYEWQARISGFLASQYRIMEMYEESERYLKEGIKYSKKVDNIQMSLLYQGLMLQEKTYFFLAKNETEKAFSYALKAEEAFTSLASERDRTYFMASNKELIGRVCIGMKKWKLAETYLLDAMEGLKKVSQNDLMINGQIYSSLGRVYFEQKKLNLAIEFLLKAEKLLKSSNNLPLEVEVYKTLSDFYLFSEKYDQYAFYNEKHIEALKKSEHKKIESINQFIHSTKAEKFGMCQITGVKVKL